jgi:predicted CXXCH cytochrome family protein
VYGSFKTFRKCENSLFFNIAKRYFDWIVNIFYPFSCRRSWRVLLIVVCGLVIAPAIADIRATPHNLIRSRDKTVNEREVCVFCHTPAVEIGDVPENVLDSRHPAWQKSIGTGFVFTIYDDIGRLGVGKPSVGSQSMSCLSCHDTNQAFEVGRTSEDHPFGVPYRGAIKHSTSFDQPVRQVSAQPFREAKHLTALEDYRDVSQGVVEGRLVWWVSRDGITARRTRGDLPLYSRNTMFAEGDAVLAGGDQSVPHIECSSCHDPHSQTKTFLRVANEGSTLCFTCHQK